MNVALLLLACAALAFALTRSVRVYALRTQLLDVPNERSSHRVPTPRGGGVAIVAAFALGCIASLWLGWVPTRTSAGLLCTGLLIAAVGFADDRWQLSPLARLACHCAAAVGFVWLLGSLPPLILFGMSLDLGWLALPLAALYAIWATNLFNFMDGIDGIAGVQALTVCGCGAALNAWAATGADWVTPALLAASAVGFLIWNWPPAKIFMGDAGSGFLGFALGALTLSAAAQGPALFWGWMILQGGFFVDATVTLIRRVRRGESPTQAHRSHAYQYASRKLGGHLPVTVAYGCITLVWLFPWALATAWGRVDGALALLLSYAPLVALAWRYKAGARELQEV